MRNDLFFEYLNTPNKELKDITPNIDWEMLSDMEKHFEANFINEYPQDSRKTILDKIEYIRIYCRQFPFFNGDDYQPLQAPFIYYQTRDSQLSELPFTEDEFNNFSLIQEALSKLGLQPQPTFEFIAFLFRIIKSWSENQITTCGAKVNTIQSLLKEDPEAKLSMNIKVNSKNIKAISKNIEFNNSSFIQSLLEFYMSNNLKSQGLIELETKRVRERTIQYLLVKTLLDNLPTKIDKPAEVKFIQAERDLALCTLYLCKLLLGDPTIVCTNTNNVTFDKLMRDFKDFEITFQYDLMI